MERELSDKVSFHSKVWCLIGWQMLVSCQICGCDMDETVYIWLSYCTQFKFWYWWQLPHYWSVSMKFGSLKNQLLLTLIPLYWLLWKVNLSYADEMSTWFELIANFWQHYNCCVMVFHQNVCHVISFQGVNTISIKV
jgi:hypothetical protein